MKRILCYLLVLLPITGCDWDNTAYEKYVNDDGELTPCPNGDSELSLNAMDLGGGRYIVRRKGNDKSANNTEEADSLEEPVQSEAPDPSDELEQNEDGWVYRCGSYNFVSDIANNLETCTDEEIEAFEAYRKIGLCPVRTPNCVSIEFYELVYNSEDNNTVRNEVGRSALCSACGDGQATCSIDGTSAATSCFDLQTDEKNCGACGNVCVDGQTCINGLCTASCGEKEKRCNDTCINITSHQFCGITDCNDYNKHINTDICLASQICTEIDGVYQCVNFCTNEGEVFCQSDGETASGSCINPSTDNNYCGALSGCKNYITCGDGTSCQDGICKCSNGGVYCETTDTSPDSESTVTKYACIDPNENNQHCGASNNCLGANEGTICDTNKNQQCIGGKCQCKDGYVDCNGECTAIDSIEYCGTQPNLDDPTERSKFCNGNSGSAKIEKNKVFTGNCEQYNGLIVNATCDKNTSCKCKSGGLYYIDRKDGTSEHWQCVDPLTDRQFCATADKFTIDKNNGNILTKLDYTTCSPGYSCVDGSCQPIITNCPSGFAFCETNSSCIDPNAYHFTSDAKSCASNWKREGSKVFDCSKPCNINISTDPLHCGAIENRNCYTDKTYTPNSGYFTCENKKCVLHCATGYTQCGNECVKLEYNNDHCGKCSTVCNVGTTSTVCTLDNQSYACKTCWWNAERSKNADLLPCCAGMRYQCVKGNSVIFTCGAKTLEELKKGYSCKQIKNRTDKVEDY